MLALLAVVALAAVNLRGAKPVAGEITLCDVDASLLCVIAFGTSSPDEMVIAFQLPEADFPPFYVMASNRGNVNTYPCESAADHPLNVYCSGARTPLGEYIDLEVYTAGENVMIARGQFILSALMRATAIAWPVPTPGEAYPNP